ncbi:MAG TPA: hypothetical protein VG798_00600, partial [Rhizomicrobium sp.]|nr:hypothetical protein [Rhizomicrobium sp.]
INCDGIIQLKGQITHPILHCSKSSNPVSPGLLLIWKEHPMTHLTLHRTLPISANERIAEIFSATTLALSSLLGLVALATLLAV